jgi:hypothetical protein
MAARATVNGQVGRTAGRHIQTLPGRMTTLESVNFVEKLLLRA